MVTNIYMECNGQKSKCGDTEVTGTFAPHTYDKGIEIKLGQKTVVALAPPPEFWITSVNQDNPLKFFWFEGIGLVNHRSVTEIFFWK